ncbi:hypothetical protein NQ314_012289 [Rhamnusium bicolor]|uniref:Peptidase M13 C-terminal domain-containing protein n=1 Tax=Rhamnusium bicolor TaxID=1586634 RepID=A0AAV8XDI1_9CUCU|nr:hypothetical protein NQ314_012289 [Rhamnusium bicolor]
MLLPTSILQGQILNENRPHYMNYGALGSIIGHEFTHGYMESSLVTYPSEIWWTNTTSRNFKKVTQCLVDEYNLYPEKLTGFSVSNVAVITSTLNN